MKNYFYSMGFMNYCSHDPGCAIIKTNGKEFDMIFAEEGFLSRKKKSYQFPIRSINYCLEYFGITLNEIDILTLDYMDKRDNYRTSNNYRLLIGDFIRSKLKIDKNKINYISSHHYAHALTAFWPSQFNHSSVMIVDGLGSEQQTHSIYYFDTKQSPKLIFEQKGTGIGTLYTLLTEAIGFESGEEGKTMGLAPYGKDFSSVDKDLPSLKGDYKDFIVDYSNQIFRNPSPKLKFNIKKIQNKKEVYNPYYSRLAYNLQKETEDCLIYLAKKTLKFLKTDSLCFSGGVALNCVANNKIQNLKEIKNFYIQPASGDTGIPIGLAISGLESLGFNLQKIFSEKNRKKLSESISKDKKPLESSYSSRLSSILKSNKIVFEKFDQNKIANEICNKNVIALFSEGIEIGPRALGNRSFIADPREFKMKDVLNSKIKHRENYRPFAPVILKEKFHDFFISKTIDHPYMLQAPKCKKITLKKAPAICHVDNTSRVQTLENDNRKIRKIVEAFFVKTGVPIIINTSFNDNDEPIVFTKLDALNSFLNCNADILILENKVIYRSSIKDIQKLKKDISAYQKNFHKEYFLKSIKNNTNINLENSNDLEKFIKFNLKLTYHYREERMILKLIEFFFNRDKSKVLYLDNYHFEIIKNLFQINGLEWNFYIERFHIIDDDLYAFGKIKNDSDFLLYNFSAHFLNTHNQNKSFIDKNIFSFYSIGDKIINIDSIIDKLSISKNSIDLILDSYEHNLKSNIDEFFKNFK